MNKIERIGGHLMKMANLLSSCCSSCVVVVGLSGGHVFILTNWQADREGERMRKKKTRKAKKMHCRLFEG